MLYDMDLCKEMLDNLFEGVYFVDQNRKIIFWSAGAEKITGYSASEVVNRFCHDNILNHVDEQGNELCFNGCPLHKTLQTGDRQEASVYLHHKAGHRVPVVVKSVPMREGESIVGAIEIFSNDARHSENSKLIDQLTSDALMDPLTQLPNRRYLYSFMENRLNEFKDFKIPFGLSMIDVDSFKCFNDNYGHDIGDAVLKMVADTIKGSLRRNDFVGRYGGDEFVAITNSMANEELKAIAEKARILVSSSEMKHKDAAVKATISIGSTLAQPQDTVDSLLKRADEALAASKKNRKNRVTIL